MSEMPTADGETSREQDSETEAANETKIETPSETESMRETVSGHELNTVKALQDDGRELSAAEALRSTMKGTHSALELLEQEKMYSLTKDEGWQQADEIKDMSDTGLEKINMLVYNRGGIGGAVTPSIVKWNRFVCVDLDEDGTKEVLVDSYDLCAVLYCANGEIYMMNVNSKFRPAGIYENGVWESRPNAFTDSYYRLYTAKGAAYKERLADQYVVPEDLNPDQTANVYKIMDNEVTKEEHDAYVEELIGGLTPLEWHDFTEENIDKYVVD